MTAPAESEYIEYFSAIERLAAILRSAVLHSNGGSQAGIILAEVTGRNPTNSRRHWASAFGQIYSLVDKAEEIERQRAEAGRWEGSPTADLFRDVRGILDNVNLDSSWNTYASQLKPLVTIAMRFVTHEAVMDRVRIGRAAHLEVSDHIRAVLTTVGESPIPPLLKAALLTQLQDLLERITRYELFGLEDVASANGALAVTVARARALDSAPNAALDDVLGVVIHIEDVILKAVSIGALLAGSARLLLGPG